MRPGSPLPYAVKREEWNVNYIKPGTVVEGKRRMWVKSGRSLLPICRTCGAPVLGRALYCRDHQRRPPPGLGGETRAESARRREETLSRLVALLREEPGASSHQLGLALPFLTLKGELIAQARRIARAPAPPALPAGEEGATA